MGFVVGVDVGGTAAKIAVFDEEGTMLGSSQVRTRLEDGGKHILPDISRGSACPSERARDRT